MPVELMFLRPREAAALAGLSTRAAVRRERPFVPVPPPAPPPPVRGSFRNGMLR